MSVLYFLPIRLVITAFTQDVGTSSACGGLNPTRCTYQERYISTELSVWDGSLSYPPADTLYKTLKYS